MGLLESNEDVKAFDTSVSMEDQWLRGAIAMAKMQDAEGKEIALQRAVMSANMRYVDPVSGKVEQLKGRQGSGFSDTNEGDGIIMLVKAVYNALKADPE